MGARLLERFSLANKGFAEIESIWFRVRVYNDAAAKQLVAFKQFKPSSARCTRSFIKEVRINYGLVHLEQGLPKLPEIEEPKPGSLKSRLHSSHASFRGIFVAAFGGMETQNALEIGLDAE